MYTPSGYSYQKKSDSWINLYAHLSLDGTVFGAWGCKKNMIQKHLFSNFYSPTMNLANEAEGESWS